MYGYLIDPEARTIEAKHISPERFAEHIREFIGTPHFDCVPLSNHSDILYVDDDGLINPGRAVFAFAIDPQRKFAGRAFIAGDGASPSPNISREFLEREIIWLDEETTGEFEPFSESVTDHPILGKITTITQGAPIFRPRTGLGPRTVYGD